VRFSIGNPLAERILFSASSIPPPATPHESPQARSTAPSSAWATPVNYPHERQESQKYFRREELASSPAHRRAHRSLGGHVINRSADPRKGRHDG
jgi:hypothetical protein